MENVRLKWMNSIFARLLITFLLIIIPVYIFGFSFYKWGENTVRKELIGSMKAQTAFFLNSLEGDINRMNSMQYEFIDDDDVSKLSNAPGLMNDIDKAMALLRIQKRLNILKSSSKYIQDASIYIPSINRVVSAAGGTRHTIDEIPINEYNILKAFSKNISNLIINLNDRLLLSVAYPVPDYGSKKDPSFVIEIELSKNDIKSGLKKLIDYNENGYLLIDKGNNTFLASNSDDSITGGILKYVSLEAAKDKRDTESVEILDKKYLITSETSEYLNMTLIKYIPENIMTKSLGKYQIWFWVFTVFALTIIIFYSFSTYSFMHKPLGRLVKSFRKVENGDFSVSIEHNHNDEFMYLYHRFNEMVGNINTLIEQVYKHKIHAKEAELKQLQSQINPHFLYNSFFILNSMSRTGEYDNLEKFTEQLGEYFQFVTRNASDMVPLKNEVDHARIYADIQTMRFSDRIRVNFADLPKVYENVKVPRLIIQPIIENAFEHSLEKKQENGILSISFSNSGTRLSIIVEDNGDGLNDEEMDRLNGTLLYKEVGMETTGIINIHRRLQIEFGDDYGLSFSHGDLGGLKVTINILLPDMEE